MPSKFPFQGSKFELAELRSNRLHDLIMVGVKGGNSSNGKCLNEWKFYIEL